MKYLLELPLFLEGKYNRILELYNLKSVGTALIFGG